MAGTKNYAEPQLGLPLFKKTMKRREFISHAVCTAFIASLPGALAQSLTQTVTPALAATDDEMLCNAKFDFALSNKLSEKPINEVIIEIGKSFIGTDYKAGVLETPGGEHLVVNLHALDCVTFYENAVALARCIKMKKFTFDDYKTQLQLIRYRGGVVNGYPSRLHYTTDYLYDGEKKGVLKVITNKLFPESDLRPIPRPINFMSAHRSLYPQLADKANFEEIKMQERLIDMRNTYYLPKDNLRSAENYIPTGSIVAITTSVPGLDISHTGIAIRLDNGELHLMHAPDIGYKVQISETTLFQYLAKHTKQTGIVVAEALEPKL